MACELLIADQHAAQGLLPSGVDRETGELEDAEHDQREGGKLVRVLGRSGVTLEDGSTVHNAFLDRRFKP